MAIFGDVNDNRVIPLLLLVGIIFLTGMYLIYFYKWFLSLICSSNSLKIRVNLKQEEEEEDFPISLNNQNNKSNLVIPPTQISPMVRG